MATRQYRYLVLFEPAEEGGYVITCPALQGLVTEGDTLEEARAMAAEAVCGYLEALAKDGQASPTEDRHPDTAFGAEVDVVEVAIETA